MKIDKRLIEEIISQIHSGETLDDIFHNIEAELLFLLKSGSFTIYKKSNHGQEIVSFFSSSDNFSTPITLPIGYSSIAGYVASSESPVSITDVYDTKELEQISPKLLFDYSYDRQSGYLSESMVVVPIITVNGLEGVLQILSYSEGGAFPDVVLPTCIEIATVLGTKFKEMIKNAATPYQALVDEGKISESNFKEAQRLAKKEDLTLSFILKDHFELPIKALASCLSEFYQVPFINALTLKAAPQELMNNLNRNFLASLLWVPIKLDDNSVRVVMEDPSNHELINEIRNVLKVQNVDACVGLTEDILLHIGLDGLDGDAEDVERIIGEISFDEDAEENQKADIMDADATSIVRLVNKIVTDAVCLGASDIHIEPTDGKPGIVRMRVDGVCRKVVEIPENLMRAVVSRVKILSNLDIAEKRKPQDGKIAVKMGGVPLELRVATLPVIAGESVVMRILQRGLPLSFTKLCFNQRNARVIKDFLKFSYGLVLVVGPTGSGKTTTLHAILYLLNDYERKILTAEDPVEIVQAGLQQVQMAPKSGLTFSTALRAFLRCDPDVILIGEMRDLETTSIGIEASLTGHLVFSTLHTNSAPETITRLLDMGIDPINFSDALVGIVAQRLARTLCSTCKVAYTPESEEMDQLINLYGAEEFEDDFDTYDLDNLTFYKANGCEKCGNSGYRGRVGVHEVLESNIMIKKLVGNRASVSDIRQQAMNDGMRILRQDAIQKIFTGVLDLKMTRKI